MKRTIFAYGITLLIIAVMLGVVFTIPKSDEVLVIGRYFEAICQRNVETLRTMLPPMFQDVDHQAILAGLNRLYTEQSLLYQECVPLLLEPDTRKRPVPYHLQADFDEMYQFAYNFNAGYTRDVIDTLVHVGDDWYILPSFMHFDDLIDLIYGLDEPIPLDIPDQSGKKNTLNIKRHVAVIFDEWLYIGVLANLDWENVQTLDAEVSINEHEFAPVRLPPSELSAFLGTTQSDTFVDPSGNQDIVWWFQVPKAELDGWDVDDFVLRIYAYFYSYPGLPAVVSLDGIIRVDTDMLIPIRVTDVRYLENDIEFTVQIKTDEIPLDWNCFNFTLFINGAHHAPVMCLSTNDRIQVQDSYIPPHAPATEFIVIFPVADIETDRDPVLFYTGEIYTQRMSRRLWEG